MSNYSIFSVMGIEIEYMLVDKDTLNVQPKSDLLLKALAHGHQVNEVELGKICLSNELVMHVLEFKNNGPCVPTDAIAQQFQETILKVQPVLAEYHLKLLPTGAHPWMDPRVETKRWPHGNRSIYKQFDKIFNCQGHGWSNLQSMHINLPFANDNEFAALHSLVRLILPILPALAASTPIIEQEFTGFQDTRLQFYEKNQKKIPSISGQIIPEIVFSEDQYHTDILHPIYRDLQPHDPNKILQHEWVNSRGAIPKFEYKALEIRVVDTQECVNADIAIAQAVFHLLKSWYETEMNALQRHYPTERLKSVFDHAIKTGLSTSIEDMDLMKLWQLPTRKMTLRDVWSILIEKISPTLDHPSQVALEHILSHGNLSERILKACQKDFSKNHLKPIYQQLSDCLLNNTMYRPS